MVVALVTLAELAILVGAGSAQIRRRAGGGAAECTALAVGWALAGLSALFQLAFLLQLPELALAVEIPVAAAALGVIWRSREQLAALAQSARRSLAHAPLCGAALALALLFLGVQALLLPPYGNDPLSYHLPRVLLFQQERTLFPAEFSKYDLVVKTLGADLLAHAFLRFHSDLGVVLLPLVAYAGALAAGFALARREARPETAWLATLAVAGMPQLVHQSAVFKSNVFALLAALLCLLLARRLCERPRGLDAALLLLMLAFGVSARPNFLSFALPFAASFGLLLARSSDRAAWRELIAKPRPLWLALLPALLLSQCWLFARNQWVFGHPGGPPSFVEFHQNRNGWLGAAANALRYALQSIDLLAPGDDAWRALFGSSLSDALEQAYARWCLPLFGSAGHSATFPSFALGASQREETSWFGPLGFLLALPALTAAAVRGSPALRAASFALLGYAALFCAGVAWFPWNARMLALVFAGAAPAIAWALEQRSPALRSAVFGIAVAVLAFACASSQPPGAWRDSDFGSDRLHWLARALDPQAIEEVRRGFPPGAEVLLIVNQRTPIEPIQLAGPEARFTLLWPWLRARMQPGFDLRHYVANHEPRFDQVLCLAEDEKLCRAPAQRERRAR